MPRKSFPAFLYSILCLVLVLASLAVTRPASAWMDDRLACLVLGQIDFTSSDDFPTTQSRMCGPNGVAVDNDGRVWVADVCNNRVLRFASLAALSNGSAAEGVLGQPDFTSSNAATTQSGMSHPYGVAVDNAGRLWVADLSNNRVLRFDNAAGKANGANADGVLGQLDFYQQMRLPPGLECNVL